ncbi:fasciclin domain-containing protein [Novosphingobium aquimarinum]|uniref:fasciclin domain-containing protein n=1 Tax=Novosphingobium aquimarinum TaxID=2682494 RepID=UPI0012EC0D38|nr:fasciclin domain-containing protein [Novosphingobium aquimarinum]
MRARLQLVIMAAIPLALTACSGEPEKDDTAIVAPAKASVAAALDDTDGMQTVAEALKETGIDQVFESPGSYTLLAPDDDAFAQLGEARKALTSGEDAAALAALLKAHILPGYVTPKDIGSAIDSSSDKAVTLRTISGSDLVFSRAGDAIVVKSEDGQTARIDGEAIAGNNSVAIPLDTVLKKV